MIVIGSVTAVDVDESVDVIISVVTGGSEVDVDSVVDMVIVPDVGVSENVEGTVRAVVVDAVVTADVKVTVEIVVAEVDVDDDVSFWLLTNGTEPITDDAFVEVSPETVAKMLITAVDELSPRTFKTLVLAIVELIN